MARRYRFGPNSVLSLRTDAFAKHIFISHGRQHHRDAVTVNRSAAAILKPGVQRTHLFVRLGRFKSPPLDRSPLSFGLKKRIVAEVTVPASQSDRLPRHLVVVEHRFALLRRNGRGRGRTYPLASGGGAFRSRRGAGQIDEHLHTWIRRARRARPYFDDVVIQYPALALLFAFGRL